MTPKEKAEELVNKHLNINLSQVDDLVDGIRIRLAQENANKISTRKRIDNSK
jgi:hypothetical protein